MIDRTDMRVWWCDFREWSSRRLVCPLLGHRWSPKMRGYVCKGCRTWTARLP